MKRKQRIILRTNTFERISFRQTSRTIDCPTLSHGIYQIVISRADAEDQSKTIIFEAEIRGLIEIKEIAEGFSLKRK